MQKVYRILEIHEVYEYKVTRYAPKLGWVACLGLYRHFFEIEGRG